MSDPSKQQPPPYSAVSSGGFVAPPAYPQQAPTYNPPPPTAPSSIGYPAYPTQQGYSAPPAPPISQGLPGGYDSDAEGLPTQSNLGGFSEKAIRRSFIRKVYGILFSQLLLTGAIISFFMFYSPAKEVLYRSRYIYWIAFAIMIVCLIAMACCEGVRRKSPTNLIFLGVFTAAEGFMLATFTIHFKAEAVLIAVGITAGVTLGLTLFAFQTKIDFTACGGMLCALLMILMIAGIILSFTGLSKAAMIGYGSAGALIFSLYIIYDTQLMMGGKHKYSLDPEEYIFAALNIYLDVINLFMYILMIVGGSSDD